MILMPIRQARGDHRLHSLVGEALETWLNNRLVRRGNAHCRRSRAFATRHGGDLGLLAAEVSNCGTRW